MAFALLAGVPAYLGIYTAVFNVLIYILLGTSKHVSVGTNALTLMLASGVVAKYAYTDKGREARCGGDSERMTAEQWTGGFETESFMTTETPPPDVLRSPTEVRA